MEKYLSVGKLEVLMFFIARIDNQSYQIQVQESAGEWRVLLTNMKTQKTETHCLSKKDYQQVGEIISFIFNHRSYLIDIIKQGDEYTVFTKGSHKTVQLLTEERKLYKEWAGKGATNGETVIRSGMPGKVIKIHVQAKEEVKEGDLLIIMEAMKMENEIRASFNGKVKTVYVKAGQNVEAKAPLLSIKPS